MLPRALSPEDESFLHAMCVHLGTPVDRAAMGASWLEAKGLR